MPSDILCNITVICGELMPCEIMSGDDMAVLTDIIPHGGAMSVMLGHGACAFFERCVSQN